MEKLLCNHEIEYIRSRCDNGLHKTVWVWFDALTQKESIWILHKKPGDSFIVQPEVRNETHTEYTLEI